MKKLIQLLTIGLILLCFNYSNGQSLKLSINDYTLKLPEGYVNFRIDENKIAIKFTENATYENIQSFLNSSNLFERFDSSWFVPFPKGIMIAQFRVNLSDLTFFNKLELVENYPYVQYVAPVLIYNEKTQQALYDLFYVKLKNADDIEELKKYASILKFEIEKEYENNSYFCKINKLSSGNSFEICKYFQNLNLFEFAEPDFILWLKSHTNDPYYAQQWALNNTGSQFSGAVAGADIDIINAWGISTGSSSIKVAILDCFGSSAQFTHPDLSFYSTYDATGNGFSSSSCPEDAHGIGCAGVIGATTNNSTGIAGISYSSKVIAVKVGTMNGSCTGWNATGNSISSGITWAWNNADIISNSNQFGSSSSLIDGAINNSISNGRNYKGTPFISSSGNDNSSTIVYPSSNSNTIAVGATNVNDTRASFSNYSTGLDITAPGVNVWSTDIAGSSGFNTSSSPNGDYFLFNGTSAACPIAAGVMALILSVNPGLTYSDARKILESTCEKVGGYTYNSSVSGQSNGTWSTNLGYGRINAYKALIKASRPDLTITVNTQSVNPSTVTAGSNVTVSCSEDNLGYASSNSNAVTIWLSPSATFVMEIPRKQTPQFLTIQTPLF